MSDSTKIWLAELGIGFWAIVLFLIIESRIPALMAHIEWAFG